MFFYGKAMAVSPAANYAKYYHKRLPYDVDYFATLVDLEDIGDRLFYRYHVRDTKCVAVSKFDAIKLDEYKQRLFENALTQVCREPDVVRMFDLGIELWHGFYSEHGRLLFDFKIIKSDCLKFQK